MDPKQIVAQGYDHIAEYHRQWASRTRMEERQRYTDLLLDSLPAAAKIAASLSRQWEILRWKHNLALIG